MRLANIIVAIALVSFAGCSYSESKKTDSISSPTASLTAEESSEIRKRVMDITKIGLRDAKRLEAVYREGTVGEWWMLSDKEKALVCLFDCAQDDGDDLALCVSSVLRVDMLKHAFADVKPDERSLVKVRSILERAESNLNSDGSSIAGAWQLSPNSLEKPMQEQVRRALELYKSNR